jgi:L-asparaginase II
MPAVPLVEVWRGQMAEEEHAGHVAVVRADDEIVFACGDTGAHIYPRSSCKIIQALPLVESGAADAFGVPADRLALACSSHNGARVHTDLVTRWIADLGLGERDLRCGAHNPLDREAHEALILSGEKPCQFHNNCSGKHAGFLTGMRHAKAGPEYLEIDHAVQRAVRAATEDLTGETCDIFGIDGCSAPNFAVTMAGLARAMAKFAVAGRKSDARDRAQARLRDAVLAHPVLVAGEGRACTELMRAAKGRAAVKVGGTDVYTAILPDLGLGVAIKVMDGSSRAVEAVMTAVLVRLGILDRADTVVAKYLTGPLTNWRGIETGRLRLAPALAEG